MEKIKGHIAYFLHNQQNSILKTSGFARKTTKFGVRTTWVQILVHHLAGE